MARQAVELVRALDAAPEIDVSVQCRPETVDFFRDSVGLPAERIVAVRGWGVIGRSLAEWIGRPRLNDGTEPDVVIGSKHLLPRRTTATRAMVVHDFVHLDRPEDFGWIKRRLLPMPFIDSIRRAEILACVSGATAARLDHHCPGVSGRVVITPNAVAQDLEAATPEPVPVLENQRFALIVGDPSPRKNLPFVFDVWERVHQHHPDLVLVRVGPPGWGVHDVSPARARLLADEALVELGHVDNGELRWLYQNASVTLCPSQLEGFGLPVLEALTFGSAVVSSTDPAQVETAAGRARIVPLDVTAWVDAVISVLAEPSPLRASPQWSWGDTANRLIETIEQHRSMQDRPTVLHVSQPVTEGVARCVIDTANRQRDDGIHAVVACPSPSPLADQLVAAGIDVIGWQATRSPGLATLGEAIALRRIVRRLSPTVVHLHSSKAGMVGRLVIRGRLATVFQPHGWSFLVAHGWTRATALLWERFAARWTSAAVSVSEGERVLAVGAGVDIERHFVIPNTIHVSAQSDRSVALRLRVELGLGTAPVVLCVGRLCTQKGQDILLEAWPAVLAAVPNARLLLAGDGPSAELLQRNPPANVSFLGSRSDVDDLLGVADVVAMPSRFEGMSLAMLEAMAAGKSVVAANVPGVGETITAVAGAVVAVGDVAGLARAISARLTDPVRTAMEGRQGQRLVIERHQPDRAHRALLDVYESLPADSTSKAWSRSNPGLVIDEDELPRDRCVASRAGRRDDVAARRGPLLTKTDGAGARSRG